MITTRSLFLLLVLAIVACGGQDEARNVSTNSDLGAEERIVLPDNIAGLYMGMFPCADCEGIVYRIELNDKFLFKERIIYKGPSSAPLEQEGRFLIDDDQRIVLYKARDNGFKYLRPHKRGMLMLDKDGNEIKGSTADMYILTSPTKGK